MEIKPPVHPANIGVSLVIVGLLLAGDIAFMVKLNYRLDAIEDSIKHVSPNNDIVALLNGRDMKTWEALNKTMEIVEKRCLK